MARVNEVLRETVAEALERLSDLDPDLGMLTVTGVTVDPDLRHATVWLDSLSDRAAEALGSRRRELQAAIAREVRLKHTPLLAFAPDPAVSHGERVEAILRELETRDSGSPAGTEHDDG